MSACRQGDEDAILEALIACKSHHDWAAARTGIRSRIGAPRHGKGSHDACRPVEFPRCADRFLKAAQRRRSGKWSHSAARNRKRRCTCHASASILNRCDATGAATVSIRVGTSGELDKVLADTMRSDKTAVIDVRVLDNAVPERVSLQSFR